VTTAAAKLRFVRDEIVLPHGRSVGEEIATGRDSWIEEEMLGPAFAVNEFGLPLFSLVYLELGRGSWKSGGSAAVACTEAILEPGTDIVVGAGDVDQGAIILGHLDGYLDRNARLASLCTKRGNERLFEGGSRIRVLSSDAATAWGLGGERRRFRAICDELTIWRSEELWAAFSSATGKVRDAQIIVLSNAGFDAGSSWQYRIREAARTELWGHLYAPPGIVASWISLEWIEQQRILLPAVAFERVIENRWTTGAGDFVTAEQWRECVDPFLQPSRGGSGRYFGGLDLGLTHDRTVLAIVHWHGDKIVLDELLVWQGEKTEPVSIVAVEAALLDAAERYPGLELYADPWQMRRSLEALKGRIRMHEFVFSQASVQKLSSTLLNAVTSQVLRVFADVELEREVLGLRVVQTGSGWRFDHRAGRFSDRAVALAMAIQLAQERGRGRLPNGSFVCRDLIPGLVEVGAGLWGDL
jgi:hypothetical protein